MAFSIVIELHSECLYHH